MRHFRHALNEQQPAKRKANTDALGQIEEHDQQNGDQQSTTASPREVCNSATKSSFSILFLAKIANTPANAASGIFTTNGAKTSSNTACSIPDTGAPPVSRIAFGKINGTRVTQISDLARQSRTIRQNPAVSVLIGEPGPKGDPLIHPRLTLQATARPIVSNTPEHMQNRDLWLETHPKAALYTDFADFAFVELAPLSVALNGGFDKAFALTPADLIEPVGSA